EGDCVVGEQPVEFLDRRPSSGLDQVRQFGGEDTVPIDVQITCRPVGSDAGETYRGVLLLTGIGDQHDPFADLGDHAARLRETAVEPDVHRAAQVPGGEVVDTTGIENT